ncbi:hypothetical protein FQZ97_1094510 [compost metagenome]
MNTTAHTCAPAADRTLYIGGASGFWGDSQIAVPQLLQAPKLDYLVFDYRPRPRCRFFSARAYVTPTSATRPTSSPLP